MPCSMNHFLKKFILTLAVLITLYGIWAFSGLAMFAVLIATSPLTAAFENLTLDYSVWGIITTLILISPFLTLRSSEFNTSLIWKILRGLWLYILPTYGILICAVFWANSVLGYQVLITVMLAVSIWYFMNFKQCVIKK